MQEHREACGQSLDVVAERMGFSSRSRLFYIESGKRPATREQLAAFVKACRCYQCTQSRPKALDELLHLARMLPEDLETTIFDKTAGFDDVRLRLAPVAEERPRPAQRRATGGLQLTGSELCTCKCKRSQHAEKALLGTKGNWCLQCGSDKCPDFTPPQTVILG
jgi:transcriptional regulator with XRE-family HTH domain